MKWIKCLLLIGFCGLIFACTSAPPEATPGVITPTQGTTSPESTSPQGETIQSTSPAEPPPPTTAPMM